MQAAREKLTAWRGDTGPTTWKSVRQKFNDAGVEVALLCYNMQDSMKDEAPVAPVRRHVNISGRSSAQLELRLHWFTRALAIRGGYIIATLRRSSGEGRHVATVAYELPLPKFARPARGAEHARKLPKAAARSPEYARGSDSARGSDYAGPEYGRGPEGTLRVVGDWPARQEQGSSSDAV